MPHFRFANIKTSNTESRKLFSDYDKLLSDRLVNTDRGVQQLNKFNRFRMFEREHTMPGTKGFIFFVRPDCYIFDNKGAVREDLKILTYINDCVKYPKGNSDQVMRQLQLTGMSHKTDLIPMLFNRALAYAPVDDQLETQESTETFHGSKIISSRHNKKIRSSGSISIPFRDNADLHVFKFFRAYYEYVEAVSVGNISPRKEDIFDGKLDYPMALYYVATELDMETIVYWERLTGLIIENIPNSVFDMSENAGNASKNFDYNINFRYSMRTISNDPYVLTELNQMSRATEIDSSSNLIAPLYVPNMDGTGDNGINMVSYPVVLRGSSKTSQKFNEYILGWCK